MFQALLASPAAAQMMGGIGQGIGAAIGAPDGPMTSGGGRFDLRSAFDGSGWTVSTGRSSATGSTRREVAQSEASNPMQFMQEPSTSPMLWLIAAGAGLLIWKLRA
jgi:hypothetical protein